MSVTVTLPDEVFQNVGGETGRKVLEQVAIEGYKSGELTAYQIQLMLGFDTPMEVDGFLKEHKIYLNYSEQEILEDFQTSRCASSLPVKP